MGERLNTQFFHGFGDRSDMTDLGRKLHYDACNAINMIALSVMLAKAVKENRIHPRKAELYDAQAGALLAQLTSDLALQDPGWISPEAKGHPVNLLRDAFVGFTRFRPETEADYASIGRQAIETAHRMLAAVPPGVTHG